MGKRTWDPVSKWPGAGKLTSATAGQVAQAAGGYSGSLL